MAASLAALDACQFLPGRPLEEEFGASFDVYFGIQPDDGLEGYARASFVDLLSIERRTEFIAKTYDILRRVRQPGGNAIETMGTNPIFEIAAAEDLETWRDFIRRALPVVIARTVSGSICRTFLNPGPGPDCGPGRLPLAML